MPDKSPELFEAHKWQVEHEFEINKWRDELALRARELDLKKQEQDARDEEIAIKKDEAATKAQEISRGLSTQG